MASPKEFNDPFDCKIAPDITQLSEKEIKAFIDQTLIKNFEDFQKNGLDIKVLMDRSTNDLTNNRELEQKKYETLTFQKQDQHFGVLSLSSRWNSILMWSHYANNHSGICIGFHTEELLKIGSLNPVIYSNRFPIISALESDTLKAIILSIYHKAGDWKYEKEYRLFDISHPDAFNLDKRKITISDKCFSDVTIGLAFDEAKISHLRNILRKKKIPLFKIEKVPLKFKLKRVRLE